MSAPTPTPITQVNDSTALPVSERDIILYDFLLVRGGAEAVTLLLHDNTPDLDLGTAFINPDAFSDNEIASKHIQTLCKPTYLLGWQTIKTSFAFWWHRHRFSAYRTVVASGAYASLSLFGRDPASNLLYCHTPPRFAYDLKDHYLNTIPRWKRPLLRLLIAGFKPLYQRSLEQVSVILANSVNVQQRIKHYLGHEAAVIYPPCNTDKYYWIDQGDYYLSTARIEPYKRVRLLVEAFKQMPDKKLVVASGGSELAALRQHADGYDNITFTGWCSDEQLQQLVGNCLATLYLPVDEDFGMSPVESMAAGKPCIGVNEGGVKETVIDGKTGLLCPAQPTVSDMIAAVTTLTAEKALAMKSDCQQHAQQFANAIFIRKMQQILQAPPEKRRETAMGLCATRQ